MSALDQIAGNRRWALVALGVALVAQIIWTALVAARGDASASYLLRPVLFPATFAAVFLTGGRTPWAIFLGRLVIGGAFLDALWGRFENFDRFIAYAGQVNAFLPRDVIPTIAVVATIIECVLCPAILLGIATRWAALGSAVLLFLFATAMEASGLSQAEWAVYVLSAGAWVIATADRRGASVDALIAPRQQPRAV